MTKPRTKRDGSTAPMTIHFVLDLRDSLPKENSVLFLSVTSMIYRNKSNTN